MTRASTDAEIPTAGTASFTGFLSISPSRLTPFLFQDYRVSAKTTLDLNLNTGDVTTETGQFYDATSSVDIANYGSRLSGSVDYSLDQLVSGANIFTGTIDGQVTRPDGSLLIVNEALVGGFMGENADGFRVVSFDDLGLNVQVSALQDE